MSGTLPLSVLLLARDEAARLDALLPRLAFARERVVVVDAATADATREVAARHGARVFERALDGFGAQRQFALEQCREDWVLWIDCDEELDARAERALRDALAGAGAPGEPAAYSFERRGWFLGRPIRFCGWQRERVTRLFRRGRARFDRARVHERLEVEGPIAALPGRIEHHSYATWAECREKLFRYAAAGAAEAHAAGRRAGPLDPLLRPPLRFARMYLLQLGFLDGRRGLVLCLLAAAQIYLKYAKLWAATRASGAKAVAPR